MNERKREQLFDKLYAKMPTLACKGLCHESCGPIAASSFEVRRLQIAGGKDLSIDEKLVCSMLTSDKKCSVYAQRPTICRLYGLTKDLACPHGCVPSRWLTKAEAHRYIAMAGQLGGFMTVSRAPETVKCPICGNTPKPVCDTSAVMACPNYLGPPNGNSP